MSHQPDTVLWAHGVTVARLHGMQEVAGSNWHASYAMKIPLSPLNSLLRDLKENYPSESFYKINQNGSGSICTLAVRALYIILLNSVSLDEWNALAAISSAFL